MLTPVVAVDPESFALAASAPLRLSIAGGGQDVPEHYLGRGCTLLAAALDLRMRVSLCADQHGGETRSGGLLGLFARRNPHLPRPVVECRVGPGAGLGGSGALAVSLVALEQIVAGSRLQATAIGLEAYRWERELLGEPVGFQDQLIASLGGVCELRADPWGGIEARRRPDLDAALDHLLGSALLLVDTGLRRRAADRLRDLTSDRGRRVPPGSVPALPGAGEWEQALVDGDVHHIGSLLRRQAAHKSALVSQAIPLTLGAALDDLTDAGVSGYKIVGAGGGGFLLLAVPLAMREAVVEATVSWGMRVVTTGLCRSGVRVDAHL